MSSIQEEGQAVPDVCRVCTVPNVAMVNIFNCINGNLADDIHFCTGIVISENDNLPNKICNGCIRQLCVAYKFKLNCLLAEKALRGLHNVVNIEIKCESIQKNDATEMGDFQCEESDSDNLSDVKEEPKARVEKKDNDTCRKCGTKFPTVEELLAHKRKCNKVKKKECICEICGKRGNPVSMYRHNLSHLPPKYFCAHCEYKSTNKNDLIKHIKLHTGEKNYQCKYCGRLFTVSSNLVSHVRRVHESTEETKLPCHLCDRRCKGKEALNIHMRSHTNERDFECEVCRTQFKSRNSWKRHLKNLHNVSIPILNPGRRRNFNDEDKIKSIEDPNGVPLLGIDLLPEEGGL